MGGKIVTLGLVFSILEQSIFAPIQTFSATKSASSFLDKLSPDAETLTTVVSCTHLKQWSWILPVHCY